MREALRKARGDIAQKTVAKDLGISQQKLSNYERGVRNPKIAMIYKISGYYGVPVEELFPDLINKE